MLYVCDGIYKMKGLCDVADQKLGRHMKYDHQVLILLPCGPVYTLYQCGWAVKHACRYKVKFVWHHQLYVYPRQLLCCISGHKDAWIEHWRFIKLTYAWHCINTCSCWRLTSDVQLKLKPYKCNLLTYLSEPKIPPEHFGERFIFISCSWVKLWLNVCTEVRKICYRNLCTIDSTNSFHCEHTRYLASSPGSPQLFQCTREKRGSLVSEVTCVMF